MRPADVREARPGRRVQRPAREQHEQRAGHDEEPREEPERRQAVHVLVVLDVGLHRVHEQLVVREARLDARHHRRRLLQRGELRCHRAHLVHELPEWDERLVVVVGGRLHRRGRHDRLEVVQHPLARARLRRQRERERRDHERQPDEEDRPPEVLAVHDFLLVGSSVRPERAKYISGSADSRSALLRLARGAARATLEPMKKRVVILGGGTGGTLVANRLRRRFDEDALELHVVDRDDAHVYQPGLLFVPFGLEQPERLVRQRRRQLHNGIEFHESEVDSVALDEDTMTLADGSTLAYDALVVATGARLLPEETEGMLGDWWRQSVFTFYDLDGAVALRDALARFDGGRLVVDIVDMPIKCPVAPIEFTFLADWFLRERGIRDRTELVLATPLDGCFTKPIASERLTYLLD